MAAVGALISGGTELVSSWLDNRSEAKQAEKEIKRAKIEAAKEAYQQKREDAHEWEMAALKKSGWRDDWFTILLSIPAILAFVSFETFGIKVDGPAIVTDGFQALQQTPEWFQILLQVAVYSAFGIKVGGNAAKKSVNALVRRMERKDNPVQTVQDTMSDVKAKATKPAPEEDEGEPARPKGR